MYLTKIDGNQGILSNAIKSYSKTTSGKSAVMKL